LRTLTKVCAPFEEADSEDFFGRETLVQDLLGRMAEENDLSRFLAVIGPSGSGKSSAVKAGLIPSLRRGGLPGSEHWFIVEFTPGSHPFEELETALLRVAVNPPESLLGQLRQDERGLLRAIGRILPPDKLVDLVLVIDQFEELFTLLDDEDTRAAFLESLLTALLDPRSRLRVVITLRADFTDRPLEYVDFGELVRQRTEFVLPLTPDELELAITQPARQAGLALEPGLSGRIIRDLGDQPGVLPLLQYALTELYERRVGRRLTLGAYQDSGGVLGALGKRAEEIYSDLDQTGQETARQVFLRLVTLGEGVEDTRRRVLQSELDALSSRSKSGTGSTSSTMNGRGEKGVREVFDSFGRARLLSFDHDPLTRGPTVEVAHEALLREWPRLREWLDESRADIRNQRVLGNAASDWLNADRDPSFLLRGSRLDQFAAWVETTDLALTQLEAEYVEACLSERRARESTEAERLAHEAALERRSRNFLRGLVAVMAVAAVVAIVLSIYAFNQREQARIQASIGLASQSLLEMNSSHPERTVPLALEALEEYPYTWQAERALGQAVLTSNLKSILSHEETEWGITTAFWSPDGRKILTGGDDGSVRVWDASSGDELTRITDGAPHSGCWSPDGESILTANTGEIPPIYKVWDAKSGQEKATLDMNGIDVEAWITLAEWYPWSPSGDRIFIWFEDGTIRIWDAETGKLLQTLSGHQGNLTQALWSPHGDFIASSGYDSKVMIWSADTGEALHSIPAGEEGELFWVASWSPDGVRIAVRGFGGVNVYDAHTGEVSLNLSVPLVEISRAKWSPDGKRLLTTGIDDGTARIWDTENGQEISHMPGLVWAQGADWSPSGDLVAVGGYDGLVHLYDPIDGLEVTKMESTLDSLWQTKFSPNGERLLAMEYQTNIVDVFDLPTALMDVPLETLGVIGFPEWSRSGEQVAIGIRGLDDYYMKIWDSTSGEEIMTLSGNGSQFINIEWSPAGDRFVTSISEGMAKVWDAASGELLQTFNKHENQVFYARWSPDGSKIASVGPGGEEISGEVIIWDPDTGNEYLIFSDHPGDVWNAVWSPSGEQILSFGTDDGMIWDAITGEVLTELYLEDSTEGILDATWMRDGQQIILLKSDGIVHIFDSSTGESTSHFQTPNRSGYISISPSGERVVIGGATGVATVWDIASGAELFNYEVGGYVVAKYSPDETKLLIGNFEGDWGMLQVFPVWDTLEELVAYAKECCVVRELTTDERELFGLPPR